MSRIRVVCCSCFIEKCVFFCQTKCNFDELMSTNSELFIKETREHSLFSIVHLYIYILNM